MKENINRASFFIAIMALIISLVGCEPKGKITHKWKVKPHWYTYQYATTVLCGKIAITTWHTQKRFESDTTYFMWFQDKNYGCTFQVRKVFYYKHKISEIIK